MIFFSLCRQGHLQSLSLEQTMERVGNLDAEGVAGQDTDKAMHYIYEYTMLGSSTSAAITRSECNMSLSSRWGGLTMVSSFGDHAQLPPIGAKTSQLSPQACQQREPERQQLAD